MLNYMLTGIFSLQNAHIVYHLPLFCSLHLESFLHSSWIKERHKSLFFSISLETSQAVHHIFYLSPVSALLYSLKTTVELANTYSQLTDGEALGWAF